MDHLIIVLHELLVLLLHSFHTAQGGIVRRVVHRPLDDALECAGLQNLCNKEVTAFGFGKSLLVTVERRNNGVAVLKTAVHDTDRKPGYTQIGIIGKSGNRPAAGRMFFVVKNSARD